METKIQCDHVDAQQSAGQSTAERALSRRGFLGRAGGVAAATATAGTLATLPLGGTARATSARAESGDAAATARADTAYTVRVAAARAERARPLPAQRSNGDEALYATTRIGSYTKGLPHNDLGEVDPAAYTALLRALESRQPADFAAIPLAGKAKALDPQGSYAFALEGADAACLAVPPAPAFSSAEEAAEMAEMYWLALARDVPFASYATDPLIGRAAADLARLSDFRGPKAGGAVTRATVFRGGLADELSGPYVSQFLWLPVPYGTLPVAQRYPVPPSTEFMTTYDGWMTVQQGRYSAPKKATENLRSPHYGLAALATASPAPTRYMCTGRDIAQFLHGDFTYQAYLNTALILLKLGVPVDAGNPYKHSTNQAGVGTFGPHHLLDLVAKVANAAVRASWYHKWVVHRRLRPEEFGGRVHNHKRGAAQYPLHADLLSGAAVLDAIVQKHGSYLLPMPFPDGCPTMPSYPAGHPAITGACVTVLKAWFDEAAVLSHPVVASPDGRTLLPYTGAPLTVGGELNKLAGNLMVGRGFGGVHWRSDNSVGLRQGEAVALGILADERNTFNQTFGGFSLTTFDGATITA